MDLEGDTLLFLDVVGRCIGLGEHRQCDVIHLGKRNRQWGIFEAFDHGKHEDVIFDWIKINHPVLMLFNCQKRSLMKEMNSREVLITENLL